MGTESATLFSGLEMVLSLSIIFLMVVGVLIGILAGSIPGLTGGIAIALFLPFTYQMSALPALVFLLSIFTGSTWGGAVTAILINTPGSPASAATAFDGYPMTQKGQGGRALGLSIGASVVGALIGAIFLMVAIEPLGRFTLKFHSSERFLIAIFGLSIIASIGGKNPLKAYLAGIFGILLGTVGMAPTGALRGTLGWSYLLDGFPIIPALIGLFAIPEIFRLMNRQYITHGEVIPKPSLGQLLEGVVKAIRHPFLLLRSALIGVGVGALPAAGATVATLISYNQAYALSKQSDLYGTGIPEGIISAEAANSSSEGGSVATMLALGIPGGMGTAVLIGALITQGWIPGPNLIWNHLDVIYGVLWAQIFQALLLLPLGIIFAFWASKIVFVPTRILIPIISVTIVAGVFALNYNTTDVYMTLAFGIIGWSMRKYGYPLIALILGIILGPMADAELIRISQRYAGDYTIFFTRPISLALITIIIILTLFPVIRKLYKRK
jgi:putative tricarboxylic transport membrane protein